MAEVEDGVDTPSAEEPQGEVGVSGHGSGDGSRNEGGSPAGHGPRATNPSVSGGTPDSRALSRFHSTSDHGSDPTTRGGVDAGLVPRTGGVADIETFFAGVRDEHPGTQEAWDSAVAARPPVVETPPSPLSPPSPSSLPSTPAPAPTSEPAISQVPVSDAVGRPPAGSGTPDRVTDSGAAEAMAADFRVTGPAAAAATPPGSELALNEPAPPGAALPATTSSGLALSGMALPGINVPAVNIPSSGVPGAPISFAELVVTEPLVPYWHPDLIAALDQLSAEVARVRLPLDVPGVEAARRTHEELLSVLTTSVLPRLREPSRPLLVAVGGGTGVGKSTLLNSLLGDVVSPPGVVRPTTRQPILICAPGDLGAFGGGMSATPGMFGRTAIGGGTVSGGPNSGGSSGGSFVDDRASSGASHARGTAGPGTSGTAADGRFAPTADASFGPEADAGFARTTDGYFGTPHATGTTGTSAAPQPGGAHRAGPDATSQYPSTARHAGPGAGAGPDGASPYPGAAHRAWAEAGADAEPDGASPYSSAAHPAGAGTGARSDGASQHPGAAHRAWPGAGSTAGAGADSGTGARFDGASQYPTPPPSPTSQFSPPAPRPHPSLPPGLALLDTPDVDSVVADNRAVGTRLLACADVVVLVTSAERYADAPPWRILKRAGERGTPLAVVLDRVPAAVAPVVRDACEALLDVNGLGGTPLFVVETQRMEGGLLPAEAVSDLGRWLQRLAEDRARVGARAVRGRLEAFSKQVSVVAEAAAGQWKTVDSLQQVVEHVYTAERVRFRGGLENGDLFGGEVLVRWQELLGVDSVAALLDGDADAPELRDALIEAVAQGCGAAMERAVRKTREGWHAVPGAPDLEPAVRYPDAVGPAAHWLERLPGVVRDLVRTRRSVRGDGARGAALLLGLAAIAGRVDDKRPPSALAVHEHVRAVFGEDGASQLLTMAQTGLRDACSTLLERSADTHRAQLGAYQVKPHTADALRTAEENVRVAR